MTEQPDLTDLDPCVIPTPRDACQSACDASIRRWHKLNRCARVSVRGTGRGCVHGSRDSGGELAQAEAALRLGLRYEQDQPLRFGRG